MHFSIYILVHTSHFISQQDIHIPIHISFFALLYQTSMEKKHMHSCGLDFVYIMKSTDRKLVYSFDYSKISSGFITICNI